MKKESLSASMPKLIMTVSLIVCIGALLGVLGYFGTMPKSEVVVNNEVENKKITQDETADWKTYRNEEYGFEIDYPSNWKFNGTNADSFINITSYDLRDPQFESGDENGVNIQIDAESLTKEMMLNEFYDEMSGNQSVDPADAIGPQSLFLNGYSAFKQSMYNTEFYLLLSKDGKTKIHIDIRKGENESFNGTADQILSTFKFIEKDETADWQTYRNEEYGFEFKYPKDWGSSLVNNKSKILFGCSNDDFKSNEKCLLTLSFPDEFPDINYRSKTWIAIDSRSAEKYIGYGVCKSIFVISDYNDDNRQYKISLDYECSSEDENKILDWIISTFKFTKQLDVDNWNIYNDDNYGFQLRYPESFSVVDLDQIKNNISPFYQNWIQYIFEREYFGKPVILITSDKYGNFIVVHINKKDKGSECSKNDFLIGKKGQMMSKETTVKEVISEVDFYKEEWREGMDGSHFLNYRTVHNNKCFMITTNLEDSYPSNPVKMDLYNKIIHSFEFI